MRVPSEPRAHGGMRRYRSHFGFRGLARFRNCARHIGTRSGLLLRGGRVAGWCLPLWLSYRIKAHAGAWLKVLSIHSAPTTFGTLASVSYRCERSTSYLSRGSSRSFFAHRLCSALRPAGRLAAAAAWVTLRSAQGGRRGGGRGARGLEASRWVGPRQLHAGASGNATAQGNAKVQYFSSPR